jgi:sulfoxide reductase heme-binding subunit YedZ
MQARSLDSRPLHRFHRYVVLLALASALTYLAFLLAPSQTVLQRMSIATAYSSLILLALVLSIGPLNVLRAKWNPLSSHFRRDLGIVGAIVAIVHVILGLQVHFRGDFMQYFFHRMSPSKIGTLRLDAFGITNHVGLIATLILLVLLAISSNLAMRKLGPERWKAIQRWNYAAALLVALHAFIYQWLEGRKLAFVAFIIVAAGIVATLQVLGFRQRRETQPQSANPCAL